MNAATITEKMPLSMRKKYRLRVGETYTYEQLSERCNVIWNTLQYWRQHGYVRCQTIDASERQVAFVGNTSLMLTEEFDESITYNIQLAYKSYGLPLSMSYGHNGWMMLMMYYMDLVTGLYDLYTSVRQTITYAEVQDFREVIANCKVTCRCSKVDHYCTLFSRDEQLLEWTVRAAKALQRMLSILIEEQKQHQEEDDKE